MIQPKSNTALHQILEPDTGAACLPGGTPEPEDHAGPETTLIREAREEAAAELAGIRYLGYLSDPGEPCARVRYAAALTSLGPAPVDPATGRTYARILATPEQAVEFFDWGPPAAEQLRAVLDRNSSSPERLCPRERESFADERGGHPEAAESMFTSSGGVPLTWWGHVLRTPGVARCAPCYQHRRQLRHVGGCARTRRQELSRPLDVSLPDRSVESRRREKRSSDGLPHHPHTLQAGENPVPGATKHSVCAERHQFRLGPRISASEAGAFEAEHRLVLPAAYRAFLIELGGSGAGPFYGLLPLRYRGKVSRMRPWPPPVSTWSCALTMSSSG